MAFGSMPQLIPVEMVATAKVGQSGRGERARASMSDQQVIRFVAPPGREAKTEVSA